MRCSSPRTEPRRTALRRSTSRSGVGVTIGELARAAAAAVDRDLPVRNVPGRWTRRDAPTFHELVADTSLIRTTLDWNPRTPLIEGLRRTIDWFRNPEEV